MKPSSPSSAVQMPFLALAIAAALSIPPDSATGQETASEVPAISEETFRQGIRLTPRAVRAAVQRVAPSLVTIESFGGSSAVAGRIGGIRQRGEGNTTGVVISPDGLVVTSSFNFIDQPRVITVITSDGVRRPATLLGRDDSRRICLLRIENVDGLPVPAMVPPGEVRAGQWAISAGVGYGDSNPAVSLGIISAVGRAGGKALQTDANISPANYGGPLIDIEGRLFGICVPMSADSHELASGVEWYDSGIGFAIPLAGNEALIERMSRGVHIQRAFLGIQSDNPDSSSGNDGILITSIVPGSAAATAGLKTGDLLLKLDEKPLPDVAELRTILATLNAGDPVQLLIRRDDQEQTIEVVLGAPIDENAEDTPSMFPGKRKR